MAEFDPDAYLKNAPANPNFDPDAYLSGKAQPAKAPAAPDLRGVPPRPGASPQEMAQHGITVGQDQDVGLRDIADAHLRTYLGAGAGLMGSALGAAAGTSDYLDAAVRRARGQSNEGVTLRGPEEGRRSLQDKTSKLLDAILGPQSQGSQTVQGIPGQVQKAVNIPPEAMMGLSPYGMGAEMAPAGMSRAAQIAKPPLTAPARALGGAMQSKGQSLMQSALKPSLQALKTGQGQAAVDTLLENGINVSSGGVEKLNARINTLNEKIADKISNSKAIVDKQAVLGRMNGLMEKFKNQVSPSSDLVAIQRAFDDFDKHPKFSGNNIPVQLAQEIKQGTYKSLGSKSYGELKGADVEAQKEMARGLKDEIAKMVPEVHQLNAEESKLLNALPLVEKRALLEANKNPFGLGWLTTDPAKFAGWMADRSSAFKSIVARMLYQGGKKLKPLEQQIIEDQIKAPPEVPGLSLAPAGGNIPNLSRNTGRPLPPMTLGRAQMMTSSPGAGIPRPPMETIPGHGLYPDVVEAQRAELERHLSQGLPYRHEPFSPSNQLGAPHDSWTTSAGAGSGIPRPPSIDASELHQPFRPARQTKQSLAKDILGIDFHPTPIADDLGFVARTEAEQEALRHPGVKASRDAQRKAAAERAAKKKKKDEDK